MAEPRALHAQLTHILARMARAAAEQICRVVEAELAGTRDELQCARSRNGALAVRVRALEGEVDALRAAARARARTGRPSTCGQTTKAPDSPSIHEVFGKEWCSGLWENRLFKQEEEVICVEKAELTPEHQDQREAPSVKEEDDVEDPAECPADDGEAPPNDVRAEPAGDDDDLYYVSTGFSQVAHMVPDSLAPPTTTTELIAMDGTVREVVVQHEHPHDFTFSVAEYAEEFQDLPEPSEYQHSSTDGTGQNYFPKMNTPRSAPPRLACTKCGKTFLRQNMLKRHMKSHGRRHGNTCHKCKVVFPQKNLLRTHKCLPPARSPAKPKRGVRCEICGKIFLSQSALRVHHAVHTGEKPHHCRFCGRGFTQKGNLATHERIHRGERPYVCIVCGRGFTQKGNLNQHLQVHNRRGRVRINKNPDQPEVSQPPDYSDLM